MRKPEWFPLTAGELFTVGGAASLVLTIAKEFGVPGSIAAALALSVFVVISIVWAVSKLWRYEGSRFQLILEKQNEPTLTPILECGESILVTHFGTVVPSQTYVAQMLEKLDQQVQVTRIVGPHALRDPKTASWLEKFRSHERYSEYLLPESILPFDFSIFDGKVVILYLPSSTEGSEYNRALVFRNPEVASIFRGVFERLRHSANRTSGLQTAAPA